MLISITQSCGGKVGHCPEGRLRTVHRQQKRLSPMDIVENGTATIKALGAAVEGLDATSAWQWVVIVSMTGSYWTISSMKANLTRYYSAWLPLPLFFPCQVSDFSLSLNALLFHDPICNFDNGLTCHVKLGTSAFFFDPSISEYCSGWISVFLLLRCLWVQILHTFWFTEAHYSIQLRLIP